MEYLVGTLVSLLSLLLCQVSIQLGLPQASFQASGNVHSRNHLILYPGLTCFKLFGQLHHTKTRFPMCARVNYERPALVPASVQQIALNADEVRPSHCIMVLHHGYNFELAT